MLIVKYNFEDYEIKGLKWIKDFINGKISFEKYEQLSSTEDGIMLMNRCHDSLKIMRLVKFQDNIWLFCVIF